jgi:outer membrane protein
MTTGHTAKFRGGSAKRSRVVGLVVKNFGRVSMASESRAVQNRSMNANAIIAALRSELLGPAVLWAIFGVAHPAFAQSPLSLSDAVARAHARNPDAVAATAAEREAAERVTQARGGYFPRVDVVESWQRGNQPAFVFSSLLAQRGIALTDFSVAALNHPEALDNFRLAISIEQSVFNAGTAASLRAAAIGRDVAATSRRLVDQELTSAVTDAFGRVLTASAMRRSAAAMVETARADRELAVNRRDIGRVTEADVLQLEVHLARRLEHHVQATSDERVARARLNQLIGEPLDTLFSLDLPGPVVAVDLTHPLALESEAVNNRPEVSLAVQQERLAATSVDVARSAFQPQVAVLGAWELNGDTWTSRSSSWVAGAVVRINVFHGFADQARLAEARALTTRRAIERAKAETLVRLDVHVALARLEAARASDAVGRAAADQARESRRIVRDRYASGLVDVAGLLRSADAEQQADVQQIASRVNVLTATAALQRAIGQP